MKAWRWEDLSYKKLGLGGALLRGTGGGKDKVVGPDKREKQCYLGEEREEGWTELCLQFCR